MWIGVRDCFTSRTITVCLVLLEGDEELSVLFVTLPMRLVGDHEVEPGLHREA